MTADHPLMGDAIDLLLASKSGTTAFSSIVSPKPNILLEVVFVLETVAETRWHVDQFLAPTPVRVVVDLRRKDVTEERTPAALALETEDAPLTQFLERGGFDASVCKLLITAATKLAEQKALAVKKEAETRALLALSEERQRLIDLRKLNDHVRLEEIESTENQLLKTREAIQQARLRLDAVRLIVEGPPVDEWKKR